METKDEILKEVDAFTSAAEKARNDYYAKAVRLAASVAIDSAAIGKFSEDVRAYLDADKRYTKAVTEATAACARLSRFLGGRKMVAE